MGGRSSAGNNNWKRLFGQDFHTNCIPGVISLIVEKEALM